MKFIRLGDIDAKRWVALSDEERDAMMHECLDHDDALRADRHFAVRNALPSCTSGRAFVRHPE